MYGANLPKNIEKSITGKRKRSIIYDRKSIIRSKNRFLKTDQSIMIENRFLIGITNSACGIEFLFSPQLAFFKILFFQIIFPLGSCWVEQARYTKNVLNKNFLIFAKIIRNLKKILRKVFVNFEKFCNYFQKILRNLCEIYVNYWENFVETWRKSYRHFEKFKRNLVYGMSQKFR